MKKLILAAALGLTALSMSTQAATVAQSFNVTATLTAQCVSNNAAPSDVNFGAYTAFGAAATPAPTTAITFRCTKGYASSPTASLGAGGTSGTIAGLAYTLGIGSAVKTAGASGAAGTVGTYDVYSYTITGGMVAGQAGDSSASTAPVVHTLTITY
ncbi:MAG: spore coat protein U domain-containing protein [Burkholderiales bacterium]|nr:spore coat protein U domain-containing protein [Burkholderiales bacterium]